MTVDRIVNGIAVIEDGDKMIELPISVLPDGVKEGSFIIYCDGKYIFDKNAEENAKKRLKNIELRLIKKNNLKN